MERDHHSTSLPMGSTQCQQVIGDFQHDSQEEDDYDKSLKLEASQTLETLPQNSIAFACAYGSRFLERSSNSQLDILVVVDDHLLPKWHEENILLNPSHYFPQYMPSLAYHLVNKFQNRPPGIIYHTHNKQPEWLTRFGQGNCTSDELIPQTSSVMAKLKSSYSSNHQTALKQQLPPSLWKYGVMGLHNFLNDLLQWDQFFVAGRLQKPILELPVVLDQEITEEIRIAQHINLRAALAAALVLLPQNFSELDLFYMIAGLSYKGDIRLSLGAENPNKLTNLVYRYPENLPRFRQQYASALEELKNDNHLVSTRKPSYLNTLDVPVYKFEQNLEKYDRLISRYLPQKMSHALLSEVVSTDRENVRKTLNIIIGRTVRRSSMNQLMNNSVINSPSKSLKYVAAKLLKGLRAA